MVEHRVYLATPYALRQLVTAYAIRADNTEVYTSWCIDHCMETTAANVPNIATCAVRVWGTKPLISETSGSGEGKLFYFISYCRFIGYN